MRVDGRRRNTNLIESRARATNASMSRGSGFRSDSPVTVTLTVPRALVIGSRVRRLFLPEHQLGEQAALLPLLRGFRRRRRLPSRRYLPVHHVQQVPQHYRENERPDDGARQQRDGAHLLRRRPNLPHPVEGRAVEQSLGGLAYVRGADHRRVDGSLRGGLCGDVPGGPHDALDPPRRLRRRRPSLGLRRHQQLRQRGADHHERPHGETERRREHPPEPERRAQQGKPVTQHELLRPSQALLARLTLEQVHWRAQRVVQNLDDAQVRDRYREQRVPGDAQHPPPVDEQDVPPALVRARDRSPRLRQVHALEPGDVSRVDVPRVSHHRDPRHDLAAELPELHGHEEQRGDDVDVVQLDEREEERAAEVEDLRRRAGDADERDTGKKVADGHPHRLLDYVAGPQLVADDDGRGDRGRDERRHLRGLLLDDLGAVRGGIRRPLRGKIGRRVGRSREDDSRSYTSTRAPAAR
mmetsp:Transcript_2230/g.8650  ORF Transcript_2230/g.8650 Transcript_2230/m.8650 type:complete len:468 (-) Transcript_2230:508-1911(-)